MKRLKQVREFTTFIDALNEHDSIPIEYAPKLFNTLIDKLVVHEDKQVDIHFKSGQVITV